MYSKTCVIYFVNLYWKVGFHLYRAFFWFALEPKTLRSVCPTWMETSSPLSPTLLQFVWTTQLSSGFIWLPTWCRGSFQTPLSYKTGSRSNRCPATWQSCWRRTLTGWWTTWPTLLWLVSAPTLSGCPLGMSGRLFIHFNNFWLIYFQMIGFLN